MSDSERSTALQPSPPPEGVLESAAGVLSRPVDTLRRVTSHPRVWWALLVAALIAVGSALAGAGEAERFDGFPGSFAPVDRGGAFVAVTVIVAPLVSVLLLLAWAGIVHGVARLLGGRARYEGTLSGFGFAQVPSALGIPAQLLPLALGRGGAVLSGLIQFGLFIWVLVLEVITVRENHALSTGRAVAALLIPVGVVLVLLVVLVIALVAVVAGNLGG